MTELQREAVTLSAQRHVMTATEAYTHIRDTYADVSVVSKNELFRAFKRDVTFTTRYVLLTQGDIWSVYGVTPTGERGHIPVAIYYIQGVAFEDTTRELHTPTVAGMDRVVRGVAQFAAPGALRVYRSVAQGGTLITERTADEREHPSFLVCVVEDRHA